MHERCLRPSGKGSHGERKGRRWASGAEWVLTEGRGKEDGWEAVCLPWSVSRPAPTSPAGRAALTGVGRGLGRPAPASWLQLALLP